MARFHFRAVSASGEVVEGDMDAATQNAVIEQLRAQGHLPLAAEPIGEGTTGAAGSTLAEILQRPVFGTSRIRTRDVALMTRELATLLGAGLTLDQALRLLVDQVDHPGLKRVLGDLLERIQGGSSLGDALAEHEHVFSRAYVSMVRAGETGGALEDVLGRLAGFLDDTEVLKERVKSALVYPILLLGMAGLSIVLLLTLVLPQFTPLFENAGAELPSLTRAVLALGEGAQRYWWVLLLVLVAGVWLLRREMRQPVSRARIDRFLLRVPLLGGLIAKVDTARFARTLGTLLANGVPLLNALAIVRETLGNSALREAVGHAAGGAKEGRGLAEPLARAGVFPTLALHLLAVGEKSGRLESMLLKIAEIFDADVRRTIERLMALLVPSLTISLGLIIAGIIGAILSAILSAYQLPF